MNRSPRELGWAVWLGLLPWAPFLYRLTGQTAIDLWHVQTAWFHVGLVLLGSCSLAQGWVSLPNRPLASWLLWNGLWTGWLWHVGMLKHGVYPMPLLMGLGHLASIGVFWVVATNDLPHDTLPWLWRVLAWSAAGLVLYGVCQHLNLDQFFHDLDATVSRDQVQGTLGNPNHYGVFLAMSLPLFLSQPERWWKGLVVIALFLMSTTSSAGVWLSGSVGWLWWTWAQAPRWRWGLLILLIGGGTLSLLLNAPEVLNPHGRLVTWRIMWPLLMKQPITGFGPGFMMEASRGITDPAHPLYGWRHLHCEPYQVWLEQGLIGLGLASWVVGSALQRAWALRAHPLGAVCGAMLLAILANSCLNFPFHLAALSVWAMLAWITLWVLDEQESATSCP